MPTASNVITKFISASVLLLACSANAQTTTASGAAQYTLSGTVVNSVTGEPVRRALVEIYLGGRQSMLTDGSGHFEFTDLPPGQTSVRVHKPGFFADQDVNVVQGAPALIDVGSNTAPVVLKLIPEGVITGRVEDRYSEGIDNLPIRVLYLHIMNGRRQWEQL